MDGGVCLHLLAFAGPDLSRALLFAYVGLHTATALVEKHEILNACYFPAS